MEIVEPGFGIVVIATIADGVDITDMGGTSDGISIAVGYGQHLAPCVILVLGEDGAEQIQNPDHITLHIAHIEIRRVVIQESIAFAGFVEHIGDEIAALFLRHHRIAVQVILSDDPANSLFHANAVGVVAIGDGGAVVGGGGQLASTLPCHGHTVPVGEGVAGGVVGDDITVIRRELILPSGGVSICIGDGRCCAASQWCDGFGQQIAVVIAVLIGGLGAGGCILFGQQSPGQTAVGIGAQRVAGGIGNLGDVTAVIVGVHQRIVGTKGFAFDGVRGVLRRGTVQIGVGDSLVGLTGEGLSNSPSPGLSETILTDA